MHPKQRKYRQRFEGNALEKESSVIRRWGGNSGEYVVGKRNGKKNILHFID